MRTTLELQAPSLNAAAAAFVPSVGAVPATYAEPYAEPYVEPYVEPGEAGVLSVSVAVE